MDLKWFNFSSKKWINKEGHVIRVFILFRRKAKSLNTLGFGILQYGGRFLFYIGNEYLILLWLFKISIIKNK